MVMYTCAIIGPCYTQNDRLYIIYKTRQKNGSLLRHLIAKLRFGERLFSLESLSYAQKKL